MVKYMLLSFYYTIGGRKLQRKLALRLKHFAQWRKSARASLRKPRHYRPACSFVLSSVTLQLIITAEAYISSAANLKPLPYYFPPMRQEKFSVTLKWNKKIFPGASVFGDFKWNKKIFPWPICFRQFPPYLFPSHGFSTWRRRRNRPIRLGTAISPLKISDKSHTRVSLATHPKKTAFR